MNPTRPAFVLLLLAAGIGLGQYLETTVPVGGAPVDILWNPTSNKVYVANSGTDNVTIIDGSTNQVVAIVDVPENPRVLAWNSRDNVVYAACGEADRVAVIDGVTNALVTSVRVTDYPWSMAYNATMNKLYVACLDNNRIAVLDAGADTVMTHVGLEGTSKLLWHPVSNRVFCLTGFYDSAVVVIDCQTDEVAERLELLGPTPVSICWNPQSDLVYAAGWNAVYVLSVHGDSVLVQMATSARTPWALCPVPDRNKLYMGDWNGADLFVIDCDRNQVVDSLLDIWAGAEMVYDAECNKVYSTSGAGLSLTIIDASADTVLAHLPLGPCPVYLAWNAEDGRAYVADEFANVVYVLRDTTNAIGEEQQRESLLPPAATVVAGTISLQPGESGRLLSSAGREVAVLRTGRNDVSGLPRGVYYLTPAFAGRIRRVVIAR